MNISAYIGFGSNLGDPLVQLHTARERLGASPGIKMRRTSPIYHSEPLTRDGKPQPWYLNCVFEIATTLGLHELFAALKGIEVSMGRLTRRRWAPRLVDLDILFYGDVVYHDLELTVPHSEMIHRKFVLLPLSDLIPDEEHPDLHMTVRELWDLTSDTLTVVPYAPSREVPACF